MGEGGMSAHIELLPDQLRPGDRLATWGNGVVTSISRGPFSQVIVHCRDKAPLALPPDLFVRVYRDGESA